MQIVIFFLKFLDANFYLIDVAFLTIVVDNDQLVFSMIVVMEIIEFDTTGWFQMAQVFVVKIKYIYWTADVIFVLMCLIQV